MSTNTRPTYEPQLRTTRRSSRSTSDADTAANDTADADSWIAQCQRQFESNRTERLHNLVDRKNQSLPRMD
ncbi:hypothetical protein KU306_01805 [Haloferax larsenii]|uniref:Uncharacterized protein n=1 Tax=Haloferax larsenii TaxID=302484 RepID=A0ABY5RI55_HALLR|nr:hypothetical protein [Haloferax larsenii]ELZ78032.1 hypothetical protein C455_10123 [Haloferax larsenii JCM 13917]UVE50658.1 hypothetical protein KU306_01805 [Haloferax larsenii]